MGLLSGILKLPVAPLTGTIAVAEQVLRQAEKEFYDPARIRAQLEEVARLRDEGALSDEEAIAWEDELVERLMIGQQRAGEERHG
jgi:chorismate mutase